MTPEAPQGKSCPEFSALATSRRTFLKGLGVIAAGGTMASMHGTVFRQTAFAETAQADNVLVVLSQRGGADGMSMVVPYGDPQYAKARPTIGVPASQLLQPNGMFGLHPNFAPLEPLWISGQMAAVHAVGQHIPNLSHFSAIVDIEEADPGSKLRTGWLNRMIGMTSSEPPYGAVQIGDGVPHHEIQGAEATMSTVDVDNIDIAGPASFMAQRKAALAVMWAQTEGDFGVAGRRALDTAAAWGTVLGTPDQPQNGAQYPSTDLGDAMAQSGRVIRADVGAEVITIDHSTWDMHTDLGTLDRGDMRLMVDDLARSVAAFFTDIGALASRVTLVTISEFGRRVIENGDAGLDHGYGNAMLVLGAGVRGGAVYGTWPGCGPDQTVAGNLAVTTDYRSVLYEIAKMQFPEVSLPVLFPGFTPERVGVMNGL